MIKDIFFRICFVLICVSIIGCTAQCFKKVSDSENEHFYNATEDVLDELREINCRIRKLENRLSCTSLEYPKTPKGPNGPCEPKILAT